MRLIDADDVLDLFYVASAGQDKAFVRTVEMVVSDTPTIDAVPVVYGRWQKRGNEKICSACKFIYYSNNDDFNYCPNCGAKMYGKRKDGAEDG